MSVVKSHVCGLSVFPLADHFVGQRRLCNDYRVLISHCELVVLSCWTDWSGIIYNMLWCLGMVETIAGSFLTTHPNKGGNIGCPSYCK